MDLIEELSRIEYLPISFQDKVKREYYAIKQDGHINTSLTEAGIYRLAHFFERHMMISQLYEIVACLSNSLAIRNRINATLLIYDIRDIREDYLANFKDISTQLHCAMDEDKVFDTEMNCVLGLAIWLFYIHKACRSFTEFGLHDQKSKLLTNAILEDKFISHHCIINYPSLLTKIKSLAENNIAMNLPGIYSMILGEFVTLDELHFNRSFKNL